MKKSEKAKAVLHKVRVVVDKINRDNVYAYAAQASFFICISAIPFLMFLLTLLRFFLPLDAAELLSRALGVLPTQVHALAASVISELYASGVPLISLTAVLLLWSASAGIRSVADGIRLVYGSRLKITFFDRYLKSFLLTLIFILLLLVTVLLLPFGGRLWDLFVRITHIRSLFGETLIDLRGLIFYLFLSAVFLALFRFLSPKGSGMRLRDHFPGAAAAGAGWVLYSWAYSLYVDHFAHYSLIYGSLTAVILFMLWLYMSMLILLLGAELNVFLYRKKTGYGEKSE